jgi:predicted nucleotide-binding protein (sugar kinase/HSP70/actin superfamily)
LKINMGNYIESLSQGADTIVLSGSCGPCRFGYYGVVQQEILRDMGYEVDVVIIDAPQLDFKVFMNKIRHITGGRPWPQVLRAFHRASKITAAGDELLDISLKKRPRELLPGETDRILSEFDREFLSLQGSREIYRLIARYKEKMAAVQERRGARPLRIGLIGEIYTLIEPYVNLHVEKKLGKMGVEVARGITIHEWVKHHLSLDIAHKRAQRKILKKAAPYLNLCVGGHAWQTIASAVHYAEEGLDGAIQIMPFGCMPEIVARTVLDAVSRDYGIPVLTFFLDEHAGEAGMQTRLEAFVDMLRRRRQTGVAGLAAALTQETALAAGRPAGEGAGSP